MPFYPSEVQKRFLGSQNAGSVEHANAMGRDASFLCGSFVGFSLEVDDVQRAIVDARYRTNGCGFMTAAADALAGNIKGMRLSDLRGLVSAELTASIEAELGLFPPERRHCADCCVNALRAAFADHRMRQVEEFRGETALICTCFGVTEETLAECIERERLTSIDEVSQMCRAGSGCGSCRMLIEEMLDERGYGGP